MKIGYLGPEGTLTEGAAQILSNLNQGAELVPVLGVPRLFDEATKGSFDFAVVPAENSLEGSVNATWDWLVFRAHLTIGAEVALPVEHCLVGHRAQKLNQIRTVLSHPQALAQCQEYLLSRLPQAREYETVSTAEAARVVSVNRLPMAAIATSRAAQEYGLDILEYNIQDVKENYTRFILVGKEAWTRPEHDQGSWKTTIVCKIAKDRPGSLRDILDVFAKRNINLARIESRPARKNLGDYIFLIDLEGQIDSAKIVDSLAQLEQVQALAKILGSYPVISS